MASPRRRLGSPRTINSVYQKTKFPPLSRKSLSEQRCQRGHHNGLQDALQITGIETETPEPASSRTASSSSRIEISSAKLEELKDLQVREKQYKNKLSSLQKLIEQLRAELKVKQEEIDNLILKMAEVEQKYKQLFEGEQVEHEKTKTALSEALKLVKEKESILNEMKKAHDVKLKDLTFMYEKRLADLRAEKDKEIALRDTKLHGLKMKMADALKDNSWERQQQLEELSKELNRINEECRLLKSKMRALKVRDENCQNCQDLLKQVEHKRTTIENQEATIKQLATLCKKFELQLTQQDDLLKQWADSKGYKIGTVPNKR
ncbi:uncharacterized protein LOC100373108 [Saccoglossus kowalevskii]|uniref:Interaptin-like n=1 Tax=Saccoglossus kowalevskii TaxID=10224 RepID=A0ABM0M2X1_SACKO|nr:PREDICTED: interaptin-like [Saccoglossus kowalevskii]